MKTIRSLLVFTVFCSLFVAGRPVFAQGTAFTYQGQLTGSNGPVTGSYDVTFKLFNASSGGAQIGSTITDTATAVSNGLFTVLLDFGAVFNGTSYWLELGVRSNGVGSYATLVPRQQLTPTPYAITAETVDGFVPGSQLTGTLPNSLLSGTYTSAVNLNNAGNSFNGSFSGSGSGLTSLNASQLTSGTVPDARLSTNVALLNGNQMFTGSNTFYGHPLVVTSNSSIDTSVFTGLSLQYYAPSGEGALMSSFTNTGLSGMGFLTFYTKDFGQPITKRMTINETGLVGIGMDPAAQLDLQSGNQWDVFNVGTPGDFRIGNGALGLKVGVATSGGGAGDTRMFAFGGTSRLILGSTNNDVLAVTGQSVGINTLTPNAAALDVANGDVRIDGHDLFLTSTSTTNNGTGIGHRTGMPGLSSTGPFVYGIDGGALGGLAPTTIALSWDWQGNAWVSNNFSTATLTLRSGALRVTGATTNTTATATTAAFTQIATAGNLNGDGTIINNSLCNGDPNAILIVTPNWNPHGRSGVFWNKVVGVYYDGTNWEIFNEDGTAMSAGAAFNVLIIKN